MAGYWTFKDYVGDEGVNEIHAWLSGLPKQARRRINIAIRRLEAMEKLAMPHVRVLTGPCAGLMELRIPVAGVQYRPLCCYGPGRGEITLLVGAIEKGDRLVPSSACSTALMNKARIAERGRTCDHDFS